LKRSLRGAAILLAFYASAVNPLADFTLASNAILAVAAVVLMYRRRWMAVPFLALAAAYWSCHYWCLPPFARVSLQSLRRQNPEVTVILQTDASLPMSRSRHRKAAFVFSWLAA
jgi:hypothetical protein